jgi:molybdopterin-biosynthesis enzyme MoeA-like protein
VHENHLALANVPKGARKILADRYPWPLLAMDNVFVLPGIPEIFQRKLAILREHLKTAGGPFVSRAAYTRMDEAVLKPLLDSVVARNPEVEVGSYPRWNDPKYDTKLTFDGKNVEAVERAFAEFLELLPPGEPQWIE